jgi:hypothetical protein
LFCWIRYEELIQNPLPTLENVLSFMTLSSQHLERLLTVNTSVDELAFPKRERLWKADACQSLLPHRVQAWQRLDGTQWQVVEQILGDEIRQAGYDLVGAIGTQKSSGLLAKCLQFASILQTMRGMPISVWIGELRYRLFWLFLAI